MLNSVFPRPLSGLRVPLLPLCAALTATAAIIVAAPAAHAQTTVYSNNFSSGLTTNFSSGTVTTAPLGEKFLSFGGAGGTSTLTLTGLPAHNTVALSFTLDVVGSMDGTGTTIQGGGIGDFFNVTYAGTGSGTLYNQALANYDGGNKQTFPVAGSAPTTGASGVDTLGYTGFPDSGNGVQDSIYNVSVTPITDSAGTISFTFTDNSNEGASNEFYGIDNVVVQTSVVGAAGAPEPGAIALLATALPLAGGVAIKRRRRAI